MTAAEAAALDTLASRFDRGVPRSSIPEHVIDGLVIQELAWLYEDAEGDRVYATVEGALDALDRLGKRVSAPFN